eukprot:TRINITY_DN11776_c0_g1_i3.p1 TRINITY_DN11776_c0_g1~~TRINITY_DN11776_c0_g1_i3.p1  ORF type:complete len:216 (+),score=23.57 TRINITY_DN11776_c0_g1_i3:1114-1761(+)
MDDSEDFPQQASYSNAADWQHDMRWQMQEIFTNCFLGPYAVARKDKLEDLLAAGITHIICIRAPNEAMFLRTNFPDHFKYLTLDLGDGDFDNLLPLIEPFTSFLEQALATGGRVLVHDNVGISQGASLIIAYLMKKHGISYNRAMTYVQNKRFCINPSDSFQSQLEQYEAIYRADNAMYSRAGECPKRGCDDDDDEDHEDIMNASVASARSRHQY